MAASGPWASSAACSSSAELAAISASWIERCCARSAASREEAATHSDPLEAVTVSGHGSDADAGDYLQAAPADGDEA